MIWTPEEAERRRKECEEYEALCPGNFWTIEKMRCELAEDLLRAALLENTDNPFIEVPQDYDEFRAIARAGLGVKK